VQGLGKVYVSDTKYERGLVFLVGTIAGVGRGGRVGVSLVASISRVGSTAAVASIFGVGSAGAGAAVEQASTRVPTSTARTPVSFIPLIRNYLPILINHHTAAFLKLPGVLNQ